MNETTKTVSFGVAGFAAQLTNLDITIKVLIGLLTVIYLSIKIGVAITNHWEALRHPRQYIERRRRIKTNKQETTTI